MVATVFVGILTELIKKFITIKKPIYKIFTSWVVGLSIYATLHFFLNYRINFTSVFLFIICIGLLNGGYKKFGVIKEALKAIVKVK